MTSKETLKINEHYQNLKTIAEKLKSEDDIDIDELLSDVKTATESYKICRERLDKATDKLDNIFKNSESQETSITGDQNTVDSAKTTTDDETPF